MPKKQIIANWKALPDTSGEAKSIFRTVKRRAAYMRNIDVAVCPPSPYLAVLQEIYSGKKISFGVQDVSLTRPGAYTGEVPLELYESLGIEMVIVGHSERRAMGETWETINLKLHRVLEADLEAILCIGEEERSAEGEYLSIIKGQLKKALKNIDPTSLSSITFAYEPVWAIGGKAGGAMDPHSVHEMYLYIIKSLSEMYGRKSLSSVKILYGGSVKADNTKELLEKGNVDGFLIGSASLDPEEFEAIMETAEAVSKEMS